jgi:ribose 5-phosphate isomerase B
VKIFRVRSFCIFIRLKFNRETEKEMRKSKTTDRNETAVAIASDHAGYEMKEHLKKYLQEKSIEVVDLSAPQYDVSDDYPVFGFKLAKAIASGEYKRGILLCGTGLGISMAANRIRGVRAALCTSAELAHMAREHNDANVVVVGGRTTTRETAEKIVDTWLTGTFAGDRHAKRVAMLDDVPKL